MHILNPQKSHPCCCCKVFGFFFLQKKGGWKQHKCNDRFFTESVKKLGIFIEVLVGLERQNRTEEGKRRI
jgi:hypothetical protein